MRLLSCITLLLLSGMAQATDYHLEPDRWCSSTGDEFVLTCQAASEKYKIFIYRNGQQWFKKHVWENPRSETQWELSVMKDNADILVLSQDVLFSGSRLLSILKKTGKYYQTEVAYASHGNEVSVTYGRAYKTAD